jgi:alcohol dehydrogenase (cytochrome c)
VPVTDAMLKNPAPGDWLMWRRTLNGWGYSPLTQIDKGNVKNLKQVWAHPMGMGIQESTPLVYDGVMYVPNGGDYVQAFDAKSGLRLWEYKRQYPEGVRGGTNRNLAIWGTTLIDAGDDNSMYAIDARTGKLVWETKVLEPTLPARASSGPIIADGKIITGRQCQPQATHESCVITAHDAKTGKGVPATGGS